MMVLRRAALAAPVGVVVALLASPAHAALCPPSSQPASCHALAPTAAQAKGGGTPIAISGYPPLGALAGAIARPASNPTAQASDPSLTTEVSSAAWGSAGREPIAAASLRYELKPADGLLFLRDRQRYDFTCDPAIDPLCFDDGSLVRTARATVRRRYRVVLAPGASLPQGVASAPLLVDYQVHFAYQGTHLGSSGAQVSSVRAQASVKFGTYSQSGGGFIYNGRGVDCAMNGAAPLACQGVSGAAPTKGTLPVTQANVGEQYAYYLEIVALVGRNDTPTCVPRAQLEGSPCLVDPWSGSGRVVTDPFVYVDPAWPHAALVRVEMAEDEAETTWIAPQRTPIDFDEMKLGEPAPATDGGADDGAAPGGGSSGASGGGASGGATDPGPGAGADPDAAPTAGGDGDDGGCALGGAGPGASATGLGAAAALALAALARGGRRGRRRGGS